MAQMDVVRAAYVKNILHTVKYLRKDKKLCLVTKGRTKIVAFIYKSATLMP